MFETLKKRLSILLNRKLEDEEVVNYFLFIKLNLFNENEVESNVIPIEDLNFLKSKKNILDKVISELDVETKNVIKEKMISFTNIKLNFIKKIFNSLKKISKEKEKIHNFYDYNIMNVNLMYSILIDLYIFDSISKNDDNNKYYIIYENLIKENFSSWVIGFDENKNKNKINYYFLHLLLDKNE